MAGKYSWHPQRPPSPPDPSIASKIAAIGPIAKCLEEALTELREEDRRVTTGKAARDRDDSSKTEDDIEESVSAVKQKDSLNEELSQSIIKSYADCVATTTYDNRTKKINQSHTHHSTSSTLQSPSSDNNTTAPSALLKGEIEHFNRIGGQWRIIVKNATLIPRRTKVDVGKSGRKRLSLDWNTNDTDCGKNEDDSNEKSRKKTKRESEYHFKGKVEVLAYNDDT